MITYRTKKAGVAQVVERGPEKPGVPSASLGPGTSILNNPKKKADVAQLVEQRFRKPQVDSSTLSVGSI